jgi:N-acetylglucosaminyldiphosphoundecaprenol N-acetyl-beta-D-mannosaminyltransferase
MGIPQMSIFGITVSRMGMQETVRYLTDIIQGTGSLDQAEQSTVPISRQVVTVNPIMIMAALERPEFMEVMQRAELIIPDGTGVVWAAKHYGSPVKERVPGIELLHELMKTGETYRWKVYLLGASPEVIKTAAERLQTAYPLIDMVGHHDGYFGPAEDEQIIADIRKAAPQLLFVARSLDMQEPWIHKHRDQLNVPVMMGVGGSFDVIAGRVKRAPKLFQALRLEWFYRLLKEPTRYKRMLALPKFVLKVIRAQEKQ